MFNNRISYFLLMKTRFAIFIAKHQFLQWRYIHWRFFDITFEIHGNHSRTHGYISVLEFSQAKDRIKVVEQIRGDLIDKIYK
jgi:hypothetical protein